MNSGFYVASLFVPDETGKTLRGNILIKGGRDKKGKAKQYSPRQMLEPE